MIQRPLVLSGYAKFIDPELASVGPQQCTKILADPIDNFVGLDLTKPEEHPLHVSEGLDDIVRFLPSCNNTLSDTSGGGGGSGTGTVVVTWRGIMTKIMTEEPVALLACRYKGVVYLRKNPESELNTNTVPTHPAEIWGRNFEQKIVVSTEEGSKLKEHEFNGIFKTRISGIKIIYGAEIDCSDADGQFVELKTCSIHVKPTHKNSNNNFWHSKAPKYWAQCYLVGIERLLVGFRNNYGILKELQWFQTSDLQKQIPFQVSFNIFYLQVENA